MRWVLQLPLGAAKNKNLEEITGVCSWGCPCQPSTSRFKAEDKSAFPFLGCNTSFRQFLEKVISFQPSVQGGLACELPWVRQLAQHWGATCLCHCWFGEGTFHLVPGCTLAYISQQQGQQQEQQQGGRQSHSLLSGGLRQTVRWGDYFPLCILFSNICRSKPALPPSPRVSYTF